MESVRTVTAMVVARVSSLYSHTDAAARACVFIHSKRDLLVSLFRNVDVAMLLTSSAADGVWGVIAETTAAAVVDMCGAGYMHELCAMVFPPCGQPPVMAVNDIMISSAQTRRREWMLATQTSAGESACAACLSTSTCSSTSSSTSLSTSSSSSTNTDITDIMVALNRIRDDILPGIVNRFPPHQRPGIHTACVHKLGEMLTPAIRDAMPRLVQCSALAGFVKDLVGSRDWYAGSIGDAVSAVFHQPFGKVFDVAAAGIACRNAIVLMTQDVECMRIITGHVRSYISDHLVQCVQDMAAGFDLVIREKATEPSCDTIIFLVGCMAEKDTFLHKYVFS